ncbi:ribosomal oxygenase 1 [Neocloeon triangulifer]|uniref:ribosomal oxygenase 1 n=1 Tax=Neocloeon triangulifer TaxID=2078957 RepID=UPI00286EF407|nr:ribosomal oxygenase 1 [Neocloeon triangulifer]
MDHGNRNYFKNSPRKGSFSISQQNQSKAPPVMMPLIHPANIKKEPGLNAKNAFVPGPFVNSEDESASTASSTTISSRTNNGRVKKLKKNQKKLQATVKTVLSSKKNDISGSKWSPLNGKPASPQEEKSSIEEGRETFAWIIHPVPIDEFFSMSWEKRPLHIGRENPSYYSALISTSKFDTMLRKHNIQFTKNLDVTSYKNGKRETHNPDGRALPAQVWEAYKNGCSIRMLNPQTFNKHVFALNVVLQEFFGTMVGANLYLTPPGTQGFAPHYDDIEAFVIQLEGKKHWRLYTPRDASEELPRFSSSNLKDKEIGKPIMDVVLEAGDMLYFPRGTIHQANALPDSHSFHITVSCYQKNSWGDFLLKLIPAALEMALEENVEFRRGLPLDYLQYMGIAHCEQESSKRTEFISKLKMLTEKLFSYAPVDAAADQMGKDYLLDILPPNLREDEIQRMSVNASVRMEDGILIPAKLLTVKTKIKYLRANIVRLVSEEETVRVYHAAENSLEYHAEGSKFFEVSAEEAGGIETLLHEYPSYTAIADLPLDTDAEKLRLANILWRKGLVMADKPL